MVCTLSLLAGRNRVPHDGTVQLHIHLFVHIPDQYVFSDADLLANLQPHPHRGGIHHSGDIQALFACQDLQKASVAQGDDRALFLALFCMHVPLPQASLPEHVKAGLIAPASIPQSGFPVFAPVHESNMSWGFHVAQHYMRNPAGLPGICICLLLHQQIERLPWVAISFVASMFSPHSANNSAVVQGYNAWTGRMAVLRDIQGQIQNNKGNKMTANKRLVFSAATFSLCLSQAAIADEFHYNNMLIGDRASGMGGAYTAVSDDATGLYYNPAAIVYVGDKNFSASVNAFYAQHKKYENVFGNRPFERSSSALLANYFGIVKPFGDFKIGFSYAVPDAVSEDQNQSFDNVSGSVTRYTINLNNRDNTYNVGPSIAAEVNENLSIGLTLYGHQRDVQLNINQFIERTDTTTRWTHKNFRMSETGIKPIIGVAWSPAEKLSLGFSLSRTLVLRSKTTDQNTCIDGQASGCSSPATPSIQTPTIVDSDLKRVYPTKLTVGAAYFADRNLLISGDVSYYSAVQDPVFGEKVATVNVAVGTEYYLSKQWAVRAGFYTNMANTPDIVAGVTNIEEQINLYGASLSLSNFTGSSSVTIGGTINYGTGKSQITSDLSVQNASTLGWLLFLSSSY